jgi:hypothetical protein
LTTDNVAEQANRREWDAASVKENKGSSVRIGELWKQARLPTDAILGAAVAGQAPQ